MNIYLKSAMFLLLLVATPVVFSSANIAPQATTLRKTYSNGDYSEVECGNKANSKERFPCLFRTFEDRQLSTYSFDLYDYGYDHMSVTDQYTYWPAGGGVAFLVFCNEEDFELLKNNNGLIINDMDKDFIECKIFLYPDGSVLRAKRVEMGYYANGMYYRATRDIEGVAVSPN